MSECWKNRPDRKGIKTVGAILTNQIVSVGKTDPIERGLRPVMNLCIVISHVGKTDPIERGLRHFLKDRFRSPDLLEKQTR